MKSSARCNKAASLIFITLALAYEGLISEVPAVVPPPDGGYPGFNTAEGQKALFSITTGVGNTAIGGLSLFSDTDGSFNTALGAGTLLFNLGNQNTGDGNRNTAVGTAALLNNTSGSSNTADGTVALFSNIQGVFNTAIGDGALFSNTNGDNNTAVGAGALQNAVSSVSNSVFGFDAGFNITGNDNVAVGANAGGGITGGNLNVCVGGGAGNNGFTFNNNIYIGHDVNPPGPGTESNTIRIGALGFGIAACFIQGIVGAPNFADTVKIDPATGQLGDQPSSVRFKKDIDSMGKASEAIFSLRPVTFHYKNDTIKTPQFGLIAEEVAKVDPALIGVDKEGKPYCVQYDKINAMLLNEFLKEHCKTEEQQKEIDALKAELKEQRALIQKVSARFETSRSAVQLAAENR
jgi:hypothetical protein